MSKHSRSLKPGNYNAAIWLVIPFWIVFVVVAIETGLASWVFQFLDAEMSNLAIKIVYVIPIASVSLLETWRMSLRQFTVSNQEPKISQVTRSVLSIFLTFVIILVSLYVLMLISVFLATLDTL